MAEPRAPRLGTKAVGAAGLLTAAVAAGLVAERRFAGRRTRASDNEPFVALPGEPRIVRAEDGVELYVETDGRAGGGDAPVLVFVHGYALNLECWHFQRRDLRGEHRMVLYDQRSHGRSGRSAAEQTTIDQLGRDLAAVLDATVPDGTVVLVGHSMGGMAIMALADQRPDLIGSRVVGVGFLATSPGDLGRAAGLPGLPGRLLQRSAPAVMAAAARAPGLVESGRRAGSDLGFLVTARLGFGGPVPTSYVEFTDEMLASTPIEVVAQFFPDFTLHDKYAALPVLRQIPALVMAGSRDRITPIQHSQEIADRLPSARLQILPGAGHMLMLERHGEVTDALRSLATGAGAAA